MASILELGSHQPSALSFLISEGILPTVPDSSQYAWKIYSDDSCNGVEDEIVRTDSCVVWSRNEVIHRVFRYAANQGTVTHAELTWFANTSADEPSTPCHDDESTDPRVKLGKARAAPGTKSSTLKRSAYCRVLVIILQHQAHIYPLNGANHIINLPFEVESVFPLPRGLLLQRKTERSFAASSPHILPTAPQNTFWLGGPRSQPTIRKPRNVSRKEKFMTNGRKTTTSLNSSASSELHTVTDEDELPKLFTIGDPLDELSVVTEALPRLPAPPALNTFSPHEEVLYLSRIQAMEKSSGQSDSPLLCLTLNRNHKSLSVWQCRHHDAGSTVALMHGSAHEPLLRRPRLRTSLGPRTSVGSGTPILRRSDKIQKETAIDHEVSFVSSSGPARDDMSFLSDVVGSDGEPHLFATLDEGLDRVTPKTAKDRRASSMLARAELSEQHRILFTDLARPTNISGTAGTHQRGPSFGAGERSRHSVPQPSARSSLLAQSSSFAGGPFETSSSNPATEELLKNLIYIDSMTDSTAGSMPQEIGQMRTDLVMTRIDSIDLDENVEWMQNILRPEGKIRKIHMTLGSAKHNGLGRDNSILSIMLMDHSPYLIEILCRVNLKKNVTALTHNFEGRIGRVSAYLVQGLRVRRTSRVLDFLPLTHAKLSPILILRAGNDETVSLHLVEDWISIRDNHGPDATLDQVFHFCNHLAANISSIFPPAFMDAAMRLIHTGHRGSFSALSTIRTPAILRYQTQLAPRRPIVAKALDLCHYLTQSFLGIHAHVYSIWWHAMLKFGPHQPEAESLALISTVYYLFLAYTDDRSAPHTVMPEQAANFPRSILARLPSKGDTAWKWLGGVAPVASQAAVKVPASLPASNIQQCTVLARELLGRFGRTMKPLHGATHEFVSALLSSLHLIREESKLVPITKRCPTANIDMSLAIAQLGSWLGWHAWSGTMHTFYWLDSDAVRESCFESELAHINIPSPICTPNSIYNWLEKQSSQQHFAAFPVLEQMSQLFSAQGSQSRTLESNDNYMDFSVTYAPRLTDLTNILKHVMAGNQESIAAVESMAKLDKTQLEILPEAILAALGCNLFGNRGNFRTIQSANFRNLVGRAEPALFEDDLPNSMSNTEPSLQERRTSRDIISIVREDSMATLNKDRDITRVPASIIFRADKRALEAGKLLNPLRIAVTKLEAEASWSETYFLEMQKELVLRVYQRTMAIPSGQGIMEFGLERPLLTEKIVISSFNTSCNIQPSNITISADRTNLTEEKVCWAFFHAGVSAGLRVNPAATGIDTSWLVLNKPTELGNRHAGFLLGLGLTGHLRSLAKWLAFRYLSPKHNMTTIGLLLGLAASRLGTMDTLVTRLLSVHVTRLLPSGAAELNVSPLTQTAGMMSIGLLYYDSQHRRMTEVALSELEDTSADDPSNSPEIIKDEGYRLAAGFAIGMINISHGNERHNSRDAKIVERLLTLATGPREMKFVHLLDQATAGATMAIGLMFLKSHNRAVANRIDIPSTPGQFDHVRPDILLLRVVAKNLIMWNDIQPTREWIDGQLPRKARGKSGNVRLHTVLGDRSLSSKWLPTYNIVSGLCWSIALKYAGSGNEDARDVLLYWMEDFHLLWLRGSGATKYDELAARNGVVRFLHLLVLSAAMVMAGSGDLQVFRQLRILHNVVDDVPHMYGLQQATHMAIGFLFMSHGHNTFTTSPLAVAALLASTYPLFPKDPLDNRAHLQAFRHLWALAAEPRCLTPRDTETRSHVVAPITVVLRNGTTKSLTAPCLLPPLDDIARVEIAHPEYQAVTLDFARDAVHVAAFRSHQTVFLRRKSLIARHGGTFGATLAMLGAPSRHGESMTVFDWLSRVGVFAAAGVTEPHAQELLPRSRFDTTSTADIRVLLDADTTRVDGAMALSAAARSDDRQKLEGVRLLLAWHERKKKDSGQTDWPRPEVVQGSLGTILKRLEREDHLDAQADTGSAMILDG